MGGLENKFKRLFKSIVIDIQNHCKMDQRQYVENNVSDAYIGKDSREYLCSDILRSQVEGLFEQLQDADFHAFKKKDFSHTGAARTMALDVKQWLTKFFLNCLVEIPNEYKQIFER